MPAYKDAATALSENGFSIDLKCSDGICGVCKCDVLSGELDYRDFVLSKKTKAISNDSLPKLRGTGGRSLGDRFVSLTHALIATGG